MNVFYLSHDPKQSAKWLVDKHVVKMPIESAQMLSMAHRVLDGVPMRVRYRSSGRVLTRTMYVLQGEDVVLRSNGNAQWPVCVLPNGEVLCYSYAGGHVKHPAVLWTMATDENYYWHAEYMRCMLAEYTSRYGRVHKTSRLSEFLSKAPENIPKGKFSPPPKTMPAEYKVECTIQSYRNFYTHDKVRFAKWKHGIPPEWMPA